MPRSRLHCSLLLANQQRLGNNGLSDTKFNPVGIWSCDRPMLLNDQVEANAVVELLDSHVLQIFAIQVKSTFALGGSNIQ